MRDITVMGTTGDRIGSGRLYMETLEEGGEDIDQMVRETSGPPTE